jgi:hypothetical protein
MFKGLNILEFAEKFSTEDKCREYLSDQKWGNDYQGGNCDHTHYHNSKQIGMRICSKCKYSESATAHTLLHKLKFPLRKAFHIIYTMSCNFNPDVKVVEEGNNVYLQLTLDSSYFNHKSQLVTTALLGKAKMSNEAYENPDGSPLKIDTDYLGNKRSALNPSAGPFENPGKGLLKLKIW